MWKFLLLSFLFFFVLFKVSGYIIRAMFGSLGSQRNNRNFSDDRHQSQKYRPKDGNVDVDYIPDNPSKKKKKDYGGGEYIDYEEVD